MPSKPVTDYVTQRIRFYRQQRRWTVTQMAQRAGIPIGSYSCLETGRYRLNLENLLRCQLVLGLPIDDLWPNPKGKCNRVSSGVLFAVVRAAESWLPKVVSLEEILDVICRLYDVDLNELASRSRRRYLTEARAIATQLVSEAPHLALVRLSELLGRDVSSLSHCLRRLKDRLPYEPHLRERLEAARKLLA